MKFIELIKEKQADLYGKRQPSIAFLGDSVTHGCFGLYVKDGDIHTYVESGKAYHQKVKEILAVLYPTVPITIINAGISGDTAEGGLKRLDRDVLSYEPDLVIVCFGLNDSQQEEAGIKKYTDSLKKIFDNVKKTEKEVIFLTPNLKAASAEIKFEDKLKKMAEDIIENEKAGWLDKYLDAARALCAEEMVPICDCNRIWNIFKDNGIKVNDLLSNRLNHPIEEMHFMFAYELVRTMLLK